MEWVDDEETMELLDSVMQSIVLHFNPFLDCLYKHEGDLMNPNYFVLFAIGKLGVYYNQARDENFSYKECLMHGLAQVANDPSTQDFISMFVGNGIHNGVTGNE